MTAQGHCPGDGEQPPGHPGGCKAGRAGLPGDFCGELLQNPPHSFFAIHRGHLNRGPGYAGLWAFSLLARRYPLLQKGGSSPPSPTTAGVWDRRWSWHLTGAGAGPRVRSPFLLQRRKPVGVPGKKSPPTCAERDGHTQAAPPEKSGSRPGLRTRSEGTLQPPMSYCLSWHPGKTGPRRAESRYHKRGD